MKLPLSILIQYHIVYVSWIEPTLIFNTFLGFQSHCVDVKSQRNQKSSNENRRKSGKFSKCVPPWHNNRKQQMQAIGGFEQAKGTLQEVTQNEPISLLLMLKVSWIQNEFMMLSFLPKMPTRNLKEKVLQSLFVWSERTKQMEEILNFQVPAEGLELVILLHTHY